MSRYLGLHDEDGTALLVIDDTTLEPFTVTRVDLGSPDIIEDVASDPSGDGVVDSTEHTGARAVTVELTAVGNDEGGPLYWLEKLNALCHPRVRAYLHVKAEEWEQPWRLLVVGRLWPFDVTTLDPDAQFMWKAPRGVLEAVTESSARVSPTGAGEPGIHEPFSAPLSIPAGFGTPGPIQVGGSLPVFPVIDLYGPFTDPKLFSGTGQTIFSGLTFPESRFIRIDMAARTVLADGDPSLSLLGKRVWGQSSWWPLEPGANSVNFTAASLGAGAQAIVRWRERKT